MVKVIGPLGGFDASGSLAGSIVFSKWKGRNYVRRLVKPSNPKTAPQVSVRAMFGYLATEWKGLTAANQLTWDAAADAKVISPFNAYMALNQKRWRNFLAPTQEDPPSGAGSPPTIGAVTAVAGVRQITLAGAAGTLSDGWSMLIFRELTTGFATSVSNLIAVVPLGAAAVFTYVDTPLAADEYFYNFRYGDTTGNIGAEDGEVSATVT